MAAGGAATKFYVGAVVLQQPEALDMFVRTAPADTEFVYCEGPAPQYGETWSRAGELAQQGLIRTHQRRRAGGGWQWYAVRTSKPRPRERTPQERALDDRPTAAIFAQLKREANIGAPCSSDSKLAEKAGLATRNQASWRFKKLIDVALIESTLAYEDGIPSRVVTISESPFAGTARGKSTALPKKWAALQRAAERDAAATGGQHQ